MSLTPNMNLNLPVPTVTPGPTYASQNNLAFTAIDGHNHTTGQGVQVPTAGLLINADLPFGGFNATSLRSLRLSSQASPLSLSSDLSCLYSSGGNLFYNDGIGNQIQITINGAIDASSSGGISGLGGTAASVSYSAGSSTFKFLSTATLPAMIDSGPLSIRNPSTIAYAVTIGVSSSIAANYNILLPPALPSANSIIQSDPTGNLTFTQAFTPTGAMMPFAGTTTPSGWLLCDGSAVSRTTYANLFNVIGIAWGWGDQTTTFNVPYTQGMFLRGVNAGSGNDPDASARTAIQPGGNTGDAVGTSQASQYASHSHTDAGHVHTLLGSSNSSGSDFRVAINGPVGGASLGATNNGSAGIQPGAANIQPSGGNETRPINVSVYFIIKT